jgi:hypothetical protein
MASIFKQYKDSRSSATLFTETGSFPSALRSSATDGQKSAALDMQVSLPPLLTLSVLSDSCTYTECIASTSLRAAVRDICIFCELKSVRGSNDLIVANICTTNRLMDVTTPQRLSRVRTQCQLVYRSQQRLALVLALGKKTSYRRTLGEWGN